MADYSQYQGPNSEWEEFMRNNAISSTGLGPSETILQLRDRTNAGRLKASQFELESSGLLEQVTWTDLSITTRDKHKIPARAYRHKNVPPDVLLPVYLFFHGGGFLFGTLESEDANCARVVVASGSPGIIVVNVCYRHTPEFTHPTQIHDGWDSFDWLAANIESIGGDANRVIVGGISAGAGLAASIALYEAQRVQAGLFKSKITIIGQLLCTPWLIHPSAHPHAKEHFSSVKQNENAPVLPMSQVAMFTDLLNLKDVHDPYFNVALAPDKQVKGMPRTSFLVAGQDVLRDDALIYADKLKANGVPTRVHVFAGFPHGFRRFSGLKSAEIWDSLVADSLLWFIAGSQP